MIQLLGINHRTAALEIREKFSFTEQEIVSFSDQLQSDGEIDEVVILSTCNRTEIYFSQNGWAADKAFTYLLGKLADFKKTEPMPGSCFYRYTDRQAIAHLFRVSAGLDSLLFGEDQIIGQVKDAYIFSTEKGYTDALLMRLFQKSFEAGKRVRSETCIKKGITSISHLAVNLCERHTGTPASLKVMVIGAGKAATLVITALKKLQVGELVIANRTASRARSLLNGYRGKVIGLNDVEAHLPSCHAVISASGAQRVLLSSQILEEHFKHPSQMEQVLIDISVPVSIQKPERIPDHIRIYQIDDLKEEAQQNAETRKTGLAEAEKIIEQVVDEYLQWYASRALRPAIQSITDGLDSISRNELKEFRKGNSKEVQEAMEAYSNHLTQKYARAFIKNLKELKEGNHSGNYLDVVERLFKFTS